MSKAIFDLFKRFETFELKDGLDAPLRIGFRSLKAKEQGGLNEALDHERTAAREFYTEPKQHALLERRIAAASPEEVIRMILAYEESSAAANLDLSPGPLGENPEAESAVERMQRALKEWRERRRKDLEGQAAANRSTIDTIALERQLMLLVQIRATDRWVDQSLSQMVVEAIEVPDVTDEDKRWKPGPPVFSNNPEAENYIGNLEAPTREELLRIRGDFLNKRTEQALRKAAQTASFLSNGASPEPSAASPGATDETPSTSPETSPVSTASASG